MREIKEHEISYLGSYRTHCWCTSADKDAHPEAFNQLLTSSLAAYQLFSVHTSAVYMWLRV